MTDRGLSLMFHPIIIHPIGVSIGISKSRETLIKIAILLDKRLEIGKISFHNTIMIDDIWVGTQMSIKHKSLTIMLGKWLFQIVIFSSPIPFAQILIFSSKETVLIV